MQSITTDCEKAGRSGGRGARSGGGSEATGDEGRPLPGLDLATLLDASAYHTTRDAPERIRPGTLQARAVSRVGFASKSKGQP